MAHLSTLCESGSKVMHALSRLGHNWRNVVPTHCPLCGGGAYGGALCSGCHELVTSGMRSAAPRCRRCCLVLGDLSQCPDCSVNRPAYDRIIAAFDYVEPADLLIHRLKVARRFTEVPMLAGLLADQVRCAWPDLPPELKIVPVPAGRQAIRHRGFNPASEVARALARRIARAYCPGVLLRVHDGHKQATLGREARMVATSGLYQLDADVQGACIAVVDDVLTTGSTMHNIARMLKRSGALSVHGLVLARTPRFLS